MLIKDIIFSDDLQGSLSIAAQSKQIGEGEVIAARAEATQSMVKAANNKIIFLPAMNQTVQQPSAADKLSEGHNGYGSTQVGGESRPLNARVVEDICAFAWS
ncbi:uncharacterized protein ATNIH1004_006684 [Aspergillus tanneri]|uniref:Uncharacterized protein n=1 Tax=Aspergillus tanneri TaxID=1220188 RepID=A0A5M9ME68_9EURO|nr:uncharacterized protein ATNIH1004_006684 [Aspergillus tanneri]KAA8645265.1 hypothetical protein ATNIH1004_006684 [Aspergillus tanneri]